MNDLYCKTCGVAVKKGKLREHLEGHHDGARKLDLDQVRDCYTTMPPDTQWPKVR